MGQVFLYSTPQLYRLILKAGGLSFVVDGCCFSAFNKNESPAGIQSAIEMANCRKTLVSNEGRAIAIGGDLTDQMIEHETGNVLVLFLGWSYQEFEFLEARQTAIFQLCASSEGVQDFRSQRLLYLFHRTLSCTT